MPARALRTRFPESVVRRLLDSAWWRYRPRRVGGPDWSDPVRFLDAFEADEIRSPFEPEPVGADDLLTVLLAGA